MKTQYIYVNELGSKFYHSDKAMEVLHREDGPAIEFESGTKKWYRDGKLHRTDGPAIEWSDGDKHWYQDGKRHRTDGPAIEWNDGYKEWYIDDLQLTEVQFKAKTSPHNGKKVVVDGIEYTLKA